MTEETPLVYIDIMPTKDCKNMDSYGMICVKCNQCGRFIQQTDEKGEKGEKDD